MNKLLPLLGLLVAPLASFSQARIVINGTTQVTIVENGGLIAKPIYIDVNNPNINAITTVGNLGWIVSESEFNIVKWDISANTGIYVVPFGTAGAYTAFPKPNGGIGKLIPLTVNITGAGSAGGSIKFSTYHTLPSNFSYMPSDVTNMGPIIPSISQPGPTDDSYWVVDRFWIIDPYTYGTKPSLTNITFSYLDGGIPYDEINGNFGFLKTATENTLLAQRFNPAANKGWGDLLGPVGTDVPGAGVGTAQSGVIGAANFFRSWTLSTSNSPLPIEISSFTDMCNNGAAFIQWTSQSELNNAYYTLKKTTDNIHFETVAVINGAGTTSLPSNYSVTDYTPYPGVSFYMLYQTDVDGKENYVKDIPFSGCGTPLTTSIIAYNTSNNIEIQINSIAADNYNVTLTNLLGQTIINENHSVVAGYNEIQLNNDLSSGIYILNLKGNKGSLTKKLAIGIK